MMMMMIVRVGDLWDERTRVLLLLLLLLLLTAIEFSLGGSIPYTSTDKTSKNKYT